MDLFDILTWAEILGKTTILDTPTLIILTMTALYEETALTMCLLERIFPPSFFDVMSHLPVHLVHQLDICGPVHTRWMYPMECYLETLKGFICQQAQPKGSMA